MRILDEKFKQSVLSYIFQSLLATATLVVILYFLDIFTHAAIVAAIGSSAFIVFAMPESRTAKPRNVIGGHLVAITAGTVCWFAFMESGLGELFRSQGFLYAFVSALSVGLAMFIMVITDTEHAPAAGTALGLIAHGWEARIVIFLLVGAVTLSLTKRLLRPWLKELV